MTWIAVSEDLVDTPENRWWLRKERTRLEGMGGMCDLVVIADNGRLQLRRLPFPDERRARCSNGDCGAIYMLRKREDMYQCRRCGSDLRVSTDLKLKPRKERTTPIMAKSKQQAEETKAPVETPAEVEIEVERIKIGEETRTLMCSLDADELLERGEKLATYLKEQKDQEAKKASATASIKWCKEKADEMESAILHKEEQRSVPCDVIADYQERIARVFRVDTQEQVGTRGLTRDEMTPPLIPEEGEEGEQKDGSSVFDLSDKG